MERAWHSANIVMRTAQLACWVSTALAALMTVSGAGCATYRKSREGTNIVAARQLTLRGLDSLQQNHWTVAEELFREALDASPHDEEAHCHYARALWHRQAHQEALEHMGEAARLSGGSPDRLVELGQMHMALGHVDAARHHAEQAISTDPQHAAAHALYADVLRRTGAAHEALQHYHWALDIDPDQPLVKIAVAEIYQQLDSPRRALATLQSLPFDQLAPTQAQQVLWLRGNAHQELGRDRDAHQCLAELQEVSAGGLSSPRVSRRDHSSGAPERVADLQPQSGVAKPVQNAAGEALGSGIHQAPAPTGQR